MATFMSSRTSGLPSHTRLL